MTPEEPWRVEVTKPALKDLKRLDKPVQERILSALDGLKTEPAQGDIKHLTNSRPPQWRLRVGDWRLRFTRDHETRMVRILRVLPRGRAYRDRYQAAQRLAAVPHTAPSCWPLPGWQPHGRSSPRLCVRAPRAGARHHVQLNRPGAQVRVARYQVGSTD